MSKESLLSILNNNDYKKRFTGGVDENCIMAIEEELKIQLPDSYKWFLKEFGYGRMCGVLIEGAAKNGEKTCVNITNDYRNLGLPDKYVVINDIGEWVYCLDTENMRNGECPVVDWDPENGTGKEKFDDFYGFFYNELKNAVEDK